jgi:hypothetical protein
VKVVRRWWYAPGVGSRTLADEIIDPALHTVSPGVRELACRLNNSSQSFQTAADNPARAALLTMCGEQLRQLVIAEGLRGFASSFRVFRVSRGSLVLIAASGRPGEDRQFTVGTVTSACSA